jgi:hypothetical protein
MHEEEDGIEAPTIEPKGLGMDIDMKPTSILKDGMPPTPISPVRHLEDLPEDAPVQLDSSIAGPSESLLDFQSMEVDNPAGPSRGLPPRSVSYSYSPPQQPSMLLTPPGSRTASPSPNLAHKPLPQPRSALKSPVTTATAKLRGRSRSPRRSINFDTEGISAVLDRSRSVSAHPPKRIPLERRRSSLSRARTMAEMEDDDEDDDEMDDELMPLAKRSVSFSGEREVSPPSVEEEHWENVNPELLPPPGPYIRHINFTNFKTIGSRRTQEEAVRGRFVTAGRLEGVIKVSHNTLFVLMIELSKSGHLVYDRVRGLVVIIASL